MASHPRFDQKEKRDLDIMIIKMDDVEIGGLFSMYGFGTLVLG